MHRPIVRASAVVLVAFVALVASGCATDVDAGAGSSVARTSAPPADPTAGSDASVGPGDVPGSTLDVSAVTAPPPEGLELAVVVSADIGEQEQRAADAVQAYADEHESSVTLHADESTQDAVAAALAERADVIIGIGPGVVGAIDRASASNLDVSFLILGTQLAEPTANVIAVTWPGADERAVFADEELEFSGADGFAAEAVSTGLAAFWSDLDGHVIALD